MNHQLISDPDILVHEILLGNNVELTPNTKRALMYLMQQAEHQLLVFLFMDWPKEIVQILAVFHWDNWTPSPLYSEWPHYVCWATRTERQLQYADEVKERKARESKEEAKAAIRAHSRAQEQLLVDARIARMLEKMELEEKPQQPQVLVPPIPITRDQQPQVVVAARVEITRARRKLLARRALAKSRATQ